MQLPAPAPVVVCAVVNLFLLQFPAAADRTVVDTSKRYCSLGARFAYDFADSSSYYQCVHGLAVHRRCPGDLVFSMRREQCLFRSDFVDGCSTSPGPHRLDSAATAPPTTESSENDLAQRCETCTRGKLAHAELCHRYYDCSSVISINNTYTNPIMAVCPFPTLFDDVNKVCAQPADVNCGDRLQPTEPWTRSELCSADAQTLPHDLDCHRYYDCQGYVHPCTRPEAGASSTGAPADASMLRTCDYPLLYSTVTGRCTAYDRVTCGSRREVVTPCAYRSDQCDDPEHASCQGFSDGPHVYRTREGTPHYVQCRDQRTVDKLICPVDERGLFQQFSPVYNKCTSVTSNQM